MTTVIVQPIVVQSMGYDDWWLPCGCSPSDCKVAYAPKGAGSYALSKVNLNNPGTNDAVDGTKPPTWNAGTGWTYDGTQCIRSVLHDDSGQNWSAIVKFSYTGVNENRYIFGDTTSTGGGFAIRPYNPTNVTNYMNHGVYNASDYCTSGILAIGGNKAYKNGNLVGTIGTSFQASNNIFIGCANGGGNSEWYYYKGDISSIAFYLIPLTVLQIQSIGNAMP